MIIENYDTTAILQIKKSVNHKDRALVKIRLIDEYTQVIGEFVLEELLEALTKLKTEMEE